MFEKLTDAIDVFRKGSAVANPSTWHDANSMGTTLAVFIVAALHVAKDFGYDINIDLATIDKVAIGIAAAVAWVLNNITNEHGGFLPAKPNVQPVDSPKAMPINAPATESGVQSKGNTAPETTDYQGG